MQRRGAARNPGTERDPGLRRVHPGYSRVEAAGCGDNLAEQSRAGALAREAALADGDTADSRSAPRTSYLRVADNSVGLRCRHGTGK